MVVRLKLRVKVRHKEFRGKVKVRLRWICRIWGHVLQTSQMRMLGLKEDPSLKT